MKKLVATTALVALMAIPALAQDTASTSPYLPGMEKGVRASSFIGKRIYITEGDTTNLSATALAKADTNWTDAGEISDIIMSPEGQSEAVLVDFGGFLGIGEKTVAVDMSQLAVVPDSTSPDNYFIVFHGTKPDLEAAPAFQESMVITDADATKAEGAADATAPAATDQMAEQKPAAMADKPALTAGDAVNFAEWPADAWVGTRVYDPSEADIGEISGVVADTSKAVSAIVVDVGGFLGMGEHRVALDKTMLSVVADKDGEGTHVQVNATADQLKALPKYEG